MLHMYNTVYLQVDTSWADLRGWG